MIKLARWSHFQPLSLRSKIFTYYATLIVFIFIACSIILFAYMMSFTKNLVGDYALNTIQQTNVKLDGWMKEVEALSKTVMWNDNVRNLLVNYDNGGMNLGAKQEINKYLNLLTAPRDDIYSLFLVKNGRSIYKYGSYSDSSAEDTRISAAIQTSDDSYMEGNMLFAGPVTEHELTKDVTYMGMRKVFDKYTFTSIGDMVIELKLTQLANFMKILDDGKNRQHYLVDAGGSILYSTKTAEIGLQVSPKYWNNIRTDNNQASSTKIVDNSVMVTHHRSAYTGWSIISVTPLSEIVSPFRQIQNVFIIVNIIGLSIGLMLAAALSHSITNPLTKLVRRMRQAMLGNFTLARRTEGQLHNQSYNEIEKLNHTFNEMLEGINRMINEVYEAELRQKETELKVLRAQINPHFLYNTLDIINWKLIINEQKETSQLVRALTGILRYNIDENDKPVCIREEITQIMNYLKIQQSRFDEAIELKVDIDPQLSELKISKFILQPIVENCVIHGFKLMSHGTIVIKGYLQGGFLLIEVIDNGHGMSADAINQLTSHLESSKDNSTGIGIHNVSERIKLYYGDPHNLRFESSLNEGTTVRLTLPVIK
ncbi:cache domain-containing sensor histidine kinase [Paenibacillus piri]|uniref:histidine kinase n=1 Tax=Paenibacillus piri TaxID=2547395 RepID=A0A4R5KW89_9BACL|nr:sensor histidine kinase [Paenibacillus piri]TDG00264.1 HAMP domain-containing protein [Paenibacillus piri]